MTGPSCDTIRYYEEKIGIFFSIRLLLFILVNHLVSVFFYPQSNQRFEFTSSEGGGGGGINRGNVCMGEKSGEEVRQRAKADSENKALSGRDIFENKTVKKKKRRTRRINRKRIKNPQIRNSR